uniref:Ig-like domain-containing protein n=1 Tax=Anopheles maculatus TaxID=74869 RepID=A0A182ST34_9DIPT
MKIYCPACLTACLFALALPWRGRVVDWAGRSLGLLEPKSSTVHGVVRLPRTELIGDSDRYVKAGSAVILRCVVRGALEPPSYIIWYHGTQQIFTESRRGWKTQLDRGAPDLDGDIHSTNT